ncbi:MAG: flagellar basal body L-ring protein FlgH, partial [Pseudomonadota bacterium]
MRLATGFVMLLGLAGCGTGLGEVGRTPKLSPIAVDSAYPAMPKEDLAMRYGQSAHMNNSTWRDTRGSLFLGSRAADVGDIITVQVAINDRANLDNSSNRSRTNDRSVNLSGTTDIGNLVGS